MTKIKICGIRRSEDIEMVNRYKPDYIGFVLAPSKRRISLETAQALKKQLLPDIKAVGVFVNETIEHILSYEKAGAIDIIQLHGDEDLAYIKVLKEQTKLPVIKAFRIEDEASFNKQKEMMADGLIDYILLDTFHKSSYGGTGESFNWQFLKQINRPFFMAGGIGRDNIEEALSYKPYAIDISSKVETDGVKDDKKLKELFEQIAHLKGVL